MCTVCDCMCVCVCECHLLFTPLCFLSEGNQRLLCEHNTAAAQHIPQTPSSHIPLTVLLLSSPLCLIPSLSLRLFLLLYSCLSSLHLPASYSSSASSSPLIHVFFLGAPSPPLIQKSCLSCTASISHVDLLIMPQVFSSSSRIQAVRLPRRPLLCPKSHILVSML